MILLKDSQYIIIHTVRGNNVGHRPFKKVIIMLGFNIVLHHGSKAVSKRFTICITLTLLPQQT
jgi:hypothetical protein